MPPSEELQDDAGRASRDQPSPNAPEAMRKPTDVTYGVGDRPPPAVLLATALQQAAVILVFLYPAIIIGHEVHATPAQAAAIISLTLVACAASTVMQSIGRWGIGSGYLGPATASTAFLGPCILAAQQGGLPLVAGMTITTGIAIVLLARGLNRVRGWIPPEVAGAVAFIIGVGVSLTGVRTLFQTLEPHAFAVAALTLMVAGGLSVWGRGLVRWTCVLIALVVGSVAAALLGTSAVPETFNVAAVPLIGLPDLGHIGYAFDPVLLPVFLVAGLANSLKTVGLVTTLQKLNDADWVRAEPRSISGGVACEGVTAMLSGLLATPPATMSITNVTIQAATGVTSRVVGFATAAICLVLACFPRAAALMSLVPEPVIAAILLHAGGLMLVNGMQVATSRMLDTRKSLAVGIALVTALGVETVPRISELVPNGLRPLISATALGTLVAIVLNGLLRIGVRRKVALTVPATGPAADAIFDFASAAGASWGARRDVINQTASLLAWCLDSIVASELAEGPITVTLGFDELRIDVALTYPGRPMTLSDTPPTPDELISDDDALAKLAGHMIRQRANSASVRQRNGISELRLVVEH